MPAPGRQVHLLQMGGCGFRRFRPRYRRCLNQAGTPCRTSNALFDWKEPAMPTSWSSADLLLPKGWSVVALGFVTLAFAFTIRGSPPLPKIGRAHGRDRVCQYGYISGVT